MNLKGKFPSTLIIPKPCLKALPLLVGYKNLFLTLKTILCYIVVISLIMKKNWSPPPNIWNNNSFLKLILCTLVVSTFSVTKDWIIFMIQNIDSFPLEPVLMLKFAMLPTASQLATSLDCVPNDGDNENSRYPETTFKHIRLLLEVPTLPLSHKRIC